MIKVFLNISEAITLKSAAQKQGRHIVEKDLSIIKNAAMVADGAKILWIGKKSQLALALKANGIKRYSNVDLKGSCILPGFVESHTHSIFSGDRASEFELRNQGMSYQQIAKKGGGILSTVKETRRASAAQLKQLLEDRVNVFVKQGVTTVEVKSGYGLDFKTEKKMLETIGSIKKPRIVSTYLGAHAVPKEFKSASAYIDHLISVDLPRVAKLSLAHRVDIFIEDGYFSAELADKYLAAARKLGLSSSVHTEQIKATKGYKVAIKNAATSVDHVIQLKKADIEFLAKSDVTCTLLPAADFYLQMNYPKARQLIDAGARVALATDFNPGSSPTQDLSFVGVLARLEMKMTLPEVISAYTVGGSHALGLSNSIGSLQAGRNCDFCVLDQGWENLFYQVGHHPVSQAWWQGKKLF